MKAPRALETDMAQTAGLRCSIQTTFKKKMLVNCYDSQEQHEVTSV